MSWGSLASLNVATSLFWKSVVISGGVGGNGIKKIAQRLLYSLNNAELLEQTMK